MARTNLDDRLAALAERARQRGRGAAALDQAIANAAPAARRRHAGPGDL